jgi:hypothetical protein
MSKCPEKQLDRNTNEEIKGIGIGSCHLTLSRKKNAI